MIIGIRPIRLQEEENMSDLLNALGAVGTIQANTASNIANAGTRDYKSIRTTLTQGPNGSPAAVTERTTDPGTPMDDGHETSNVDLTREMGALINSSHSYSAILRAIEGREELMTDLMDALSSGTY